MSIEFSCDCGKRLKAPDSLAGKTAKCPACGEETEVPVAVLLIDDDDEPVARLARPNPQPDMDAPNGCVLLIDDDPDLLGALEQILKDQSHRVETAMTGEEGLALARKRNPDVIVLDTMLHQMNGFDLYQEIKDPKDPANTGCRRAAVILLTPRTKEQDARRAKAIGAEAAFTKPLRVRDLCDHIETVLAEARNKKIAG